MRPHDVAQLAIVEVVDVVNVFEIGSHCASLHHRSPLRGLPRGERRASYLENKYETPNVSDGFVNQAVRFCLGVKMVEPSSACV
jgi:hypothetical protein